MDLVSVVTERSERFIRHSQTCPDCGGAGEVTARCRRHDSSNCPCSTYEMDCETCGGSGVVCDDYCYCERCMALAQQEGLQ